MAPRHGVRPPAPPPKPKPVPTWRDISTAITSAASSGIPIEESEQSVKHSSLLSRMLKSPETVTSAGAADGPAVDGYEKNRQAVAEAAERGAVTVGLKNDFRLVLKEMRLRPEPVSEMLGFSKTTLTNWLSGQLRDVDGRVTQRVQLWVSQAWEAGKVPEASESAPVSLQDLEQQKAAAVEAENFDLAESLKQQIAAIAKEAAGDE